MFESTCMGGIVRAGVGRMRACRRCWMVSSSATRLKKKVAMTPRGNAMSSRKLPPLPNRLP